MKKKMFLAFAFVLITLYPITIIQVEASSDIQVTFSTPPPTTINAGESYNFAVEVTNNGLDDAIDVIFEYRPPPKVAVTSITSSVGPGEAGTKDDPSDPATCFLGDMPSGRTETIYITVKVDEDVLPGTFLDNDVRAYHSGSEGDPPDNQNHAFVEVVLGPADLRIIKVGKPDGEVKTGENLTYTIFVDNLGPSNATDVVVTDDLISSGTYTLVEYTSSQGSGSVTGTWYYGHTITFNLGDITSGSRATITIIVTADEAQDVDNVVSVVSERLDPDWSNNLVMTEHEFTKSVFVGGLILPTGKMAVLTSLAVIIALAILIALAKQFKIPSKFRRAIES